MKIGDIQVQDVVEFMHLEEDEYSPAQIAAIMKAARNVIAEYTGIPEKADEDGKSIDRYEEFYLPFMILCQDMYDNRSLIVDKDVINPTVKLILGLHDENLVG